MSALPSSARRLGPLAAVLLVALAACDQAPAPARGPAVISAPPPPDALPDCDAIATALGELVAGLEVVDPAGTRQDTADAFSLSCAWRGADDGAALGAIVIVDQQPLTEADMRRAGLYVDDPRVAALGGFIAYPEGRLDGAEILGPVGPQVIVGPVTVTLAANARGAVADVTLAQAVDGAAAIHRLMR
ncbi:hypothetical protein [Luteimonas sp. TWI662]|uniref:hypothetical protein n=1 Tax=unclassified Luteimonas TaxID=2629088 RepID=UPI0032083315